jgi:hypothetical protein
VTAVDSTPEDTTLEVAAHDQAVSHRYSIHYPAHEPRAVDPHKADFDAYKRRRRADGTYHCDFAVQHRGGDESECDLSMPLECHHQHIEFALQNGVDLALLEQDYPGVSQQGVGAWLDSAANLELLCVFHHRGHGGKHVASVADFEGQIYVRRLLS